MPSRRAAKLCFAGQGLLHEKPILRRSLRMGDFYETLSEKHSFSARRTGIAEESLLLVRLSRQQTCRRYQIVVAAFDERDALGTAAGFTDLVDAEAN